MSSELNRRQLFGRGIAWTAATAAGGIPGQKEKPMANTHHLATLRRERPRLLATSPAVWETIRKRRASDPVLEGFLKRGAIEARAIVAAAPATYVKQGKRLLHVSRNVLRRVLLLALHAQLSGDAVLAKRAEAEMLAVSAFADWNPSHFLDVGEMTAALAFGYDWLYDVLDPDARATIATAIVEKGLRPGLRSASWATVENNWNSVCLGGLALGALALADTEPALAEQMLEKVRVNNVHGMKPYAPDGVYPEGASYWGYGTSFEVILLEALQTAIGTDWGLRNAPGFLASADAVLQVQGPTGTYFNYSDGGERASLEAGIWWYAHVLKRPDLLREEMQSLRRYAASTVAPRPDSESDRLLPLAAIWWPEGGSAAVDAAANPRPRFWYGRGPNPLGIFRNAWGDPKAMFLALKGGKATLSHGHMDAGTFVFEADGVRWARDLGAQDYLSLESKGVDLWNRAQISDRWKVFRLNNFSHNTLTINDQLHFADGDSRITHFSNEGDTPGAIVDLTAVFPNVASRVTRGFVFRPNRHALVRDEIDGLKPGDVVRWAMVTKAEITFPTPTEAILLENGQELRVRLNASVPATFEQIPADPPASGFDAPNPNTRILIARLTAPNSGKLAWSVLLRPKSATAPDDDEPLATTELTRWPLAASA